MTNQMSSLKSLVAVCLTAFAALVAAPAFADSLLNRQTAWFGEQHDSRYVTAASSVSNAGNETQAIKLFYTGTSTEAVVTINSTGFLVYAPFNTLDTTFPAGALTAALYPTIGAVCDAFNATNGKYQCRMEDARRSDPFSYLAATTTVIGNAGLNLKNIGGYPVGFAAGNNAVFSVYGSSWISLGINPPADTRVILKKCTFNSAGNGYATLSVSGVRQKFEGAPDGLIRNDSSLVWVSTSAAATATTISFDDSGYGGLTFAAGVQGIQGPSSGLPAGQSTVQSTPPNSQGRVVVRVASDGGSTSNQDSARYLYCQWTYR